MRNFKGLVLGCLIGWLLLQSSPVAALQLLETSNEHSQVQLVLDPGQEAAGQRQGMLVLGIRLQPGWKTYWRFAGDAGAPMQIRWEGSENITPETVQWPLPHRFVEPWGMEIFGYKGEVLFPIAFTIADATKAAHLRGSIDYTVCAELCIPYTIPVDAEIPVIIDADKAHQLLVEQAQARLPRENGGHGLFIDSLALEPEADPKTEKTATLVVQARSGTGFTAPDIFVEGAADFRFSAPEVTFADAGGMAMLRLDVVPLFKESEWPKAPLRLTLVDGERAIELEQQVAAVAETPKPEMVGEFAWTDELLLMLFFGWLGGLILNVMPCVLPVLSLKVMDVLRHQEAGRKAVRLSFLASSLGIISFFLLLALGAVVLRQAGMAVGWGFHFQEPAFLITLSLILLLFAGNLWGWFEINLPYWLGGHVTDTGRHGGLVGHFLTGAFAAILATPCTAPFLGTAVGFALAQPPAQVFLLFAVMGCGLATPYLLVALAPSVVRWFPKPGHWMLTLKAILGLFIFLTAVWLLWVLAAQIGELGAVLTAVAGGLLVLKVRWLQRGESRVGRMLLLALIGGLLFLVYLLPSRMHPEVQRTGGDMAWQPFDEAAIPVQVAAGHVVFVDVTADWCLTCQFNKKTVLETDAMADFFGQQQVVLMKADWTRRDEHIAAFLKHHGRGGIPMNVVFGPYASTGIVLSEVLTQDAVQAAVEQAKGPAPQASGEAASGS